MSGLNPLLNMQPQFQETLGGSMNFSDSIGSCFGKFATFKGRASRSEFWWFYLFQAICNLAALIVGGLVLFALVASVLAFPGFSVLVRRLHDTDRSGWWYWISLVPIIGGIVLLIWFCTEGSSVANEYGDPVS